MARPFGAAFGASRFDIRLSVLFVRYGRSRPPSVSCQCYGGAVDADLAKSLPTVAVLAPSGPQKRSHAGRGLTSGMGCVAFGVAS